MSPPGEAFHYSVGIDTRTPSTTSSAGSRHPRQRSRLAVPARRINGWFAETARDLPWREPDCSPWGVLVSEIMLQQTPVVRVLPVWREWLERWPTPAAPGR